MQPALSSEGKTRLLEAERKTLPSSRWMVLPLFRGLFGAEMYFRGKQALTCHGKDSWPPDSCPPPVLRVQEPGSGGLDVSPPLALLCYLGNLAQP